MLAETVIALSLARTHADVQVIVRHAARRLVGADGATFVLRDDDKCHYVDEDAIGRLWKGHRFPLESCISGWAMLNHEVAVIPDIYADDRIPHDAYRPTFVRSLVMTPIRVEDPLGAIGVYWAKQYIPSAAELELLVALAGSTSMALAALEVHGHNARLSAELAARSRAAARIVREARTDEMTGVLNRRGFFYAARLQLNATRVAGGTAVIGFFDIDGLKTINDAEGHAAGSELIVDAATVLVEVFGAQGVVARMGGDEFAMLITRNDEAEPVLRARLDVAVAARNPALRMSAGFERTGPGDTRSLAALIEAADAGMYVAKRDTGATRDGRAC